MGPLKCCSRLSIPTVLVKDNANKVFIADHNGFTKVINRITSYRAQCGWLNSMLLCSDCSEEHV